MDTVDEVQVHDALPDRLGEVALEAQPDSLFNELVRPRTTGNAAKGHCQCWWTWRRPSTPMAPTVKPADKSLVGQYVGNSIGIP
jgi:hypothetical protein